MCNDCLVSSNPFDGEPVCAVCVPFVLTASSVRSSGWAIVAAAEPFVLIDPFPLVKLLLLISFVMLGSVGIQLPVVRNFRGSTTCCINESREKKIVCEKTFSMVNL